MAKEQWHNWGRIILLGIVIIFACGGYALKINSNYSDIVVLEKEVKGVQGDVHKLELADKDIAFMAQRSIELMTEINSSLESIKVIQSKQAVVQAVNSTKLQTLTKD